MVPRQRQISPYRRGPALWEATAALQERDVLLTCSWLWDPEPVAGPLRLLPLSSGLVLPGSSIKKHQSFNAESGDTLALSQIHAALRGRVLQHREGNGGQGAEWNSLKRKIISLC